MLKELSVIYLGNGKKKCKIKANFVGTLAEKQLIETTTSVEPIIMESEGNFILKSVVLEDEYYNEVLEGVNFYKEHSIFTQLEDKFIINANKIIHVVDKDNFHPERIEGKDVLKYLEFENYELLNIFEIGSEISFSATCEFEFIVVNGELTMGKVELYNLENIEEFEPESWEEEIAV